MRLALGLDVQTNAKGGKFMSIEDSHQGALVCKVDVEVLWEPGNFQDDGAKRVGVCFASNTELESQLQRAVKVSAKGKHVKCKMDLERCLSWDPAGNRVVRAPHGPRACGGPARVACSLRCATSCWSPWRRRAALGRLQQLGARGP